MAVAEVETVKVVTVGYVLRLSEEEVDAMIAVFARIGGSPDNSPRKHTDAVKDALQLAGAPHFDDTVAYNQHEDDMVHRSGIRFTDYAPTAL